MSIKHTLSQIIKRYETRYRRYQSGELGDRIRPIDHEATFKDFAYSYAHLDELAKRILAPVADLAALAAIDTTDTISYPEDSVISVPGKGIFRYVSASTADEITGVVVKPDHISLPNPGRWHKIGHGGLIIVHAQSQNETLDITANPDEYKDAHVFLYSNAGFTPKLVVPAANTLDDDFAIHVHVRKEYNSTAAPEIDLSGSFLWNTVVDTQITAIGGTLFFGANDAYINYSFSLRKANLFGTDAYELFHFTDHIENTLFPWKQLGNNVSGTATLLRSSSNLVFWDIDDDHILDMQGFRDAAMGMIFVTQPAAPDGPYEVTLPADSLIQDGNAYLTESGGVRKLTNMVNDESVCLAFVRKGTTYIWNAAKYL